MDKKLFDLRRKVFTIRMKVLAKKGKAFTEPRCEFANN
jgi:hypothetical protein